MKLRNLRHLLAFCLLVGCQVVVGGQALESTLKGLVLDQLANARYWFSLKNISRKGAKGRKAIKQFFAPWGLRVKYSSN